MQNKYNTILFDFHGTLVRLKKDYGQLYAEIAAKHGTHLPADKIKTTFKKVWNTRTEAKIVQDHLLSTNLEHIEEWWIEYHKDLIKLLDQNISEEITQNIGKEVHTRYFSDPYIFELFPGAKETLLQLKEQGIEVIMLTNGDSRVEVIAKELEIVQYFDVCMFADKMGVQKPNPLVLEKIQQEIGKALDINRTLMVGDSPIFDIGFANNTGIDSALCGSSSELATYSINDLSELLRLV